MAAKKEPWRTMSDDEYYKAMAALMDYPHSERLPKIFKFWISPRECQEILHMPAQAEDLMEKMHLDRETIEKDLKHLYEGGICNPSRKGWRILPVYGILKDGASPSWKYDYERDYGPDGLYGKGSISQQFEELEWWPRVHEEYKQYSGGGPLMRTLSYWKAIDGIPGVEEYDDIRQILKKAEREEGSIALGRCACRWIHGVLDQPIWTCMVFGNTARYNVDRDAFRRVSYEECMKMLELSMEAGQVLIVVPDAKPIGRQICNCSMEGCGEFAPMVRYKIPITHDIQSPSRFGPVVDPEKCIACMKCIEGCPYNAALMHYYEDIGEWKSWTDMDKCKGIGHCVVYCPTGARKMKLIRPPEFIPDEYTPVRFAQKKKEEGK